MQDIKILSGFSRRVNLKKHLTNYEPLLDQIILDKALGAFRVKGGYGNKPIFEYLRGVLEHYEPSDDAKELIDGLSDCWVDWLESVIGHLRCDFEGSMQHAAQIIKFHLHNPKIKCHSELQEVGTLLLEISYLFHTKNEEVIRCKSCGNLLGNEELSNISAHICPALKYSNASIEIEHIKKARIHLSHLITKEVIRGCLLCGGELPRGPQDLKKTYCSEHDPTLKPSKYKTGLNHAKAVINYLIDRDIIAKHALTSSFRMRPHLLVMWGRINTLVDEHNDWDKMQEKFNELVILAHPQKANTKSRDKEVGLLLSEGVKQAEIARKLNITPARVSQIVKKQKK